MLRVREPGLALPGRHVDLSDRVPPAARARPGRSGRRSRKLHRALREPPARPAEPPAPKPRPIAVIAAGAPIEDIIAKLTAIQADHPGAQIRQGKRNRLEIWPPITHPANERHVPDMPTSPSSQPPIQPE